MAGDKQVYYVRIDRVRTVPQLAESSWEAVERVYSNNMDKYPDRAKYSTVRRRRKLVL